MCARSRWGRACGVVVLGLVLGLSGCGGGGGVAEPVQAPPLQGNFFPLAVGDRWIYAVEGASDRTLAAIAVSSVDNRDGIAISTSESGLPPVENTIYVVSTDSVRAYPGLSADPITEAIGAVDVMRFPLRTGDRFEQVNKSISTGLDFDGDGRVDPATVRSEVQVMGLESVATPSGVFAGSLHLRTTITIDVAPTGSSTRVQLAQTVDDWYAPDVGPVRSVVVTRSDGVSETEQLDVKAYRVGTRRSETVPPTVQSANPPDGAVRGTGANVDIVFSEQVDIASAERALALVNDSGQSVPGYASIDRQDLRTLRFRPMSPLPGGRYTVRVGAGVEDLIGNVQAAEARWSFDVDATGPDLIGSTPADGAVDVGRETSIVLRFSEPVDPATVNAATITLGGVPLALAVDGANVTVTPTQPLVRLSDYTLIVREGISDLQGNPMLALASVDFKTEPGRFALPLELMPGSQAFSLAPVAVGDVNGDGRADLVIGDFSAAGPPATYRLRVFHQAADGTLGAPVAVGLNAAQGCWPTSLAIGDADGDGRDDVVVARGGCGIEVVNQGVGGVLVPGVFIASAQSDKLRLVDFNRDGRLDLVAIASQDSIARVWRQRSDGVMVEHATPAVQTGFFPDLDVGDVNGDGLPDIVVAGGAVSVLLQLPDGSFAAPVQPPTDGRGASGVAIGDFDGDGRMDVALAFPTNAPAFVGVLRQQSDGSLGALMLQPSYDIPLQMEAADINGDGRTDLVAAHSGWNALSVYLQQPDGTLASEARYPAPSASFNPHALALGDLNGDGRIDAAYPDVVLLQRPVPLYAQRLPTPGTKAAAVLRRLLNDAAR